MDIGHSTGGLRVIFFYLKGRADRLAIAAGHGYQWIQMVLATLSSFYKLYILLNK